MSDLSKIREETMERINERHELLKKEIDKIIHEPHETKESPNSEIFKEIDKLLKDMKS